MVFCYILFPISKIDDLLADALAQQGLKITPSVHKTVLPGLAWDEMVLSSAQGELLHCEHLQVRLLLLPLIIGRVNFATNASIGKGFLETEYALSGKKALSLTAEGISLADIDFFKNVLGAKTAGNLWIHGELIRGAKGLNGELKLEIKQLEFSGVKLGAFPLPDVSGLKTQGLIKVIDGKTRLESFTLEGGGVYMRLSGDIPSGANAAAMPLDMKLAIMPKAEFLEKQRLPFMLLAKFMNAPGVYTVPIKGTLLQPQIM